MKRLTAVGASVLLAGVAAAQTGPTVATFPVDFPRPASEREMDELRAEFRDVVRKAGAVLPSGPELKLALSQLKRTDCDQDNACLAALASRTNSLYGLYSSVDVGLREITVSGRIVRDDGKEFGRVAALKAPANPKGSFLPIAKTLLTQLVEELKVSALPVTKEVKVDAVTQPVADAGVVFTPPPPPPVEPPLGRRLGWMGLAGGGGVVLLGTVLYVVGSVSSRGVMNMGVVARMGETPEQAAEAYKTARSLQPGGLAVMGAGAAIAAASVLLLVLNPEPETPTVGVFAAPGVGSFVTVQGALP